MWITPLLALVAVLALATSALASGAEPPSCTNLGWRIVNFAIFAFLLYKFFGKKAVDFFQGRRYQIENDLLDLQKRKAESETRLAEVESSIANLTAERDAILADYKAQGEALKTAIIEKAEKAAAQIRTQAEMSAAQEAKLAVDAVKAELAELVIDAAEKAIKKRLKKDDHEKLVDEYLTKVVLN